MNCWDWKYRIFFENEIYTQAVNWSSQLLPDERRIYERIIEFYRSFYSFGILLDLCRETPAMTGQYCSLAMANPDALIVTPHALIPYFKRIVKNDIPEEYQETLLYLLMLSTTGKDIKNYYWGHIKELFGSSFEEMVKCFDTDSNKDYLSIPRQKKNKGNPDELYAKYYKELSEDKRLIKQYGKSRITTYDKCIIDGNGYGEWWDRSISDTEQDKLVLYTNNGIVKGNDFFYTILHETYPGHGHFYNAVRNPSTHMDQGASILIEGWATYCEWNTYPSTYIQSIRHNAMVCLYRSFRYDINTIATEYYKQKIKQGKKVSQFAPTVVYHTQYIGFIEAYYLGALWIEKAIHQKYHTPKAFLEMLSGHNKGEFFSIWL